MHPADPISKETIHRFLTEVKFGLPTDDNELFFAGDETDAVQRLKEDTLEAFTEIPWNKFIYLEDMPMERGFTVLPHEFNKKRIGMPECFC